MSVGAGILRWLDLSSESPGPLSFQPIEDIPRHPAHALPCTHTHSVVCPLQLLSRSKPQATDEIETLRFPAPPKPTSLMLSRAWGAHGALLGIITKRSQGPRPMGYQLPACADLRATLTQPAEPWFELSTHSHLHRPSSLEE